MKVNLYVSGNDVYISNKKLEETEYDSIEYEASTVEEAVEEAKQMVNDRKVAYIWLDEDIAAKVDEPEFGSFFVHEGCVCECDK